MELKARPRTELDQKANVLRKAGFLPAVVYGEGVKSLPLAVSYKDFEKVYKEAGESTLLSLDVDGKKYNVLIHDLTYDPIRGNPIHADFLAVRMDKTIKTKVPLEFIGESPAVKNENGILVKVLSEVEVEALPQDLPHVLQVDLSSLAVFEARLRIQDILIPKGVKILADQDEIICLVEPPRPEEELEELKQAPVAAVEPVEVKTEQEVKRAAKAKKIAETVIGEPEKKKV